jgi:hypothetical protein
MVKRNIGRIVRASPDLQPLFSSLISDVARELAPLLSRRLGPGQETIAQLVAHLVSQAIALSFRSWTVGNSIAIDQVIDEANGNIRSVVQALDPGQEQTKGFGG